MFFVALLCDYAVPKALKQFLVWNKGRKGMLKRFTILALFSFINIYYILPAQSQQFFLKGHLVIDLQTGVEWMRCSVGQRWNGQNCIGKIINLNHEQME